MFPGENKIFSRKFVEIFKFPLSIYCTIIKYVLEFKNSNKEQLRIKVEV